MKVGDRVKVVKVEGNNRRWGITENLLGTVKAVDDDGVFVWVKFDSPSAYSKANQIKEAIKGLWDIEDILCDTDYYNDSNQTFGFRVDQLEVQKPKLRRGDIVRVAKLPDWYSDFGINEGDIGVVRDAKDGKHCTVLLQGDHPITENPESYFLFETDLEPVGMNISESFDKQDKKVCLDKEKFCAWFEGLVRGTQILNWQKYNLLNRILSGENYTLKEIVDMVSVLYYGYIRRNTRWEEELKNFIVEEEN